MLNLTTLLKNVQYIHVSFVSWFLVFVPSVSVAVAQTPPFHVSSSQDDPHVEHPGLHVHPSAVPVCPVMPHSYLEIPDTRNELAGRLFKTIKKYLRYKK